MLPYNPKNSILPRNPIVPSVDNVYKKEDSEEYRTPDSLPLPENPIYLPIFNWRDLRVFKNWKSFCSNRGCVVKVYRRDLKRNGNDDVNTNKLFQRPFDLDTKSFADNENNPTENLIEVVSKQNFQSHLFCEGL